MKTHDFDETAIPYESLVAFSDMNTYVSGEIASVIEGFVTHFTCEWFFSHMDTHMSGEMAIDSEGFVTHFTCEWHFSRMDTHVAGEVALLFE